MCGGNATPEMCVCVCVHVCVCVCVHARARACVCVCVCTVCEIGLDEKWLHGAKKGEEMQRDKASHTASYIVEHTLEQQSK
jgi:hypothetical protein